MTGENPLPVSRVRRWAIELEPDRDSDVHGWRAVFSRIGDLRNCEESLADLDKAQEIAGVENRYNMTWIAATHLYPRCSELYDSQRYETMARGGVELYPMLPDYLWLPETPSAL